MFYFGVLKWGYIWDDCSLIRQSSHLHSNKIIHSNIVC